MTYEEARQYIEEINKYGSIPGLASIRELTKRLGNPQDELKFVHIAGTNGKGSVLAFVSTVLKEAGYCVGRYISPTVFSYRERIQVNNQNIDREMFAYLLTKVAKAAAAMEAEGLAHPTVFEIETALGFLYFNEKKCDVVVLETGLGGTLDATNVITTTMLSVITPIAMDHMGFLGNSLPEIAGEKAGIIKPDSIVVSSEQDQTVAAVIRQRCIEQRCRLEIIKKGDITDIQYGYEKQYFSYGGLKDVEIQLIGSHQIENAALAISVIRNLAVAGLLVTDEVLRRGMAKTKWTGRFSVIGREPFFIIDGAHNKAAAEVLRKSLQIYFTNRRIFYIIGIFKDKEYEEIISITAPLAEHIITIGTTVAGRQISAQELCAITSEHHPSVEAADSVETAVQRSLELAGKEDVIVAFGSLSLLGEVRHALDRGAER